MSSVMRIGTHSGSFHADDVLAVALLRAFVDADASVVRTRDEATLAEQDVVVDVGGRFDPEARRFDHHQNAYEGARSSAGMVLDWLEHEGAVSPALATRYREVLVDYVDDVDNGRRPPEPDVPCFSSIVATLADSASDETFDALFEQGLAHLQQTGRLADRQGRRLYGHRHETLRTRTRRVGTAPAIRVDAPTPAGQWQPLWKA